MRILILGSPGSGKGTISSLLMDFFNNESVKYYNVGEILRGRWQDDDHIKEVHAAGGIVDSDRVMGIFDEALDHEWFLLDGSPRKENEAQYILNHPKWKSNPGYLIYLKIDPEAARNRLLLRKRFDDTPDVMDRRFEAFLKETTKSIQAFDSAKRLLTVDASQDAKAVCYDILKFIINNTNENRLPKLSRADIEKIIRFSGIEDPLPGVNLMTEPNE